MSATKFDSVKLGDEMPTRQHTPDNVELFLYNAAMWNPHRIHFDLPYASEVEGYPGLVIAGPMMGDWMVQIVDAWASQIDDSSSIVKVEYANRQAAYIGETLTAGGTIAAIDNEKREITIDSFIKNERDEVITPGKITVRLDG